MPGNKRHVSFKKEAGGLRNTMAALGSELEVEGKLQAL